MGICSNKAIKRGFFITVFLAIVVLVIIFFAFNKVYRAITIEAGTPTINVSEFIKKDNVTGEFITDLATINMNVPGTYEIKIQIGNRTHRSKLNIVDTVAPVAEVINQEIPFGETIEADAFVTNIIDVTDVKVSYLEEPDFTLVGDQSISIVLEDEGKNITELNAMLYIGKVYKSIDVEIGTVKLDISEFMMSNSFNGSFVTNISTIDLYSLGQHTVIIESDGEEYTSQLTIVDTVAPTADIINHELWVNDEIDADGFVENIVDYTDVTVYYKEQPDFSKAGVQEVFIVLEDTSGNKGELKATLTLIEDTEPPEIKGDDHKLVYIGERVSYRNHVTVTDNRDEEVTLEIDSSSVNLNKEGTYNVIYTATDSSGNSTTKEVTFIVREKPANYVSKEEVDKLADEVLAQIIKDNMSEKEKARAIYNWTRSRIAYVSYANNTDWVRGAYDGIKRGRGDCYAYFATAKQLLTRAGIENMDIVKTGGGHYWNMVNLGDGWYHFDATPRRTGGEFFMLTDAELDSYSKRNKNSHVWDREKYPATPLK